MSDETKKPGQQIVEPGDSDQVFDLWKGFGETYRRKRQPISLWQVFVSIAWLPTTGAGSDNSLARYSTFISDALNPRPNLAPVTPNGDPILGTFPGAAEVKMLERIRWIIDALSSPNHSEAVAVGTVEPKTHEHRRAEIDSGWWLDFIKIDFRRLLLYAGEPDRSDRWRLLYSGITIYDRDQWREQSAESSENTFVEITETPDKKERRGRPPKWDWGEFDDHVRGRLESEEGLPPTQADFEEEMANWFMEHYDDHPAVSQIRKRVSPYYEALAGTQKTSENQ